MAALSTLARKDSIQALASGKPDSEVLTLSAMWSNISGMKTNTSVKKMEEEIAAIQKQLLELGPMHPGSVSSQYQVCGKPGCKCLHPTKPERHGPYCKLSYVHRGKKVCRFVRADTVVDVKARLKNYKEFRRLTDRWIQLSIKRAQLEFFSGAPQK
jgi:hypothetical protein